jgi:hypothetical protein
MPMAPSKLSRLIAINNCLNQKPADSRFFLALWKESVFIYPFINNPYKNHAAVSLVNADTASI